jgi:hypothetical protein
MRSLLPVALLSAAQLFAAHLAAQTTNDIGITMGTTTLFGQFCGPVPCTPMPGPTIARGTSAAVTQNAAPNTPFAMAIGAPATGCLPIPGIANGLLMVPPLAVFAIGVTGGPVPVAFGLCPRGVATVQLAVPANAPAGFAFALQSVGVDWIGQLGFSNAIACVTQ